MPYHYERIPQATKREQDLSYWQLWLLPKALDMEKSIMLFRLHRLPRLNPAVAYFGMRWRRAQKNYGLCSPVGRLEGMVNGIEKTPFVEVVVVRWQKNHGCFWIKSFNCKRLSSMVGAVPLLSG